MKFFILSLMFPFLALADDFEIVEQISGRLNQLMAGPSTHYCMDCTEERNRNTQNLENVQERSMVIQTYERCRRPLNNLNQPAQCEVLRMPSNRQCQISVTSRRSDLQAGAVPVSANVHVPGIHHRRMLMDRVVFFNGSAKGAKPLSLGQYSRWSRQRNNVNFTYQASEQGSLELENFSVDLNVRDEGEWRVWDRLKCEI